MLKLTQVSQAKVKITVQKTRKTYYRTMNYAKQIKKGSIGQQKIEEYFLREGRRWKKASREEYEVATNEESVKKLQEQLTRELRRRVEQEMKENAVGT